MGEEKTLWLRRGSVIRLFVSHSLTVLRRANIPGDSVGDGREKLLESTPAGIARPAKMTIFGARRAPPRKHQNQR